MGDRVGADKLITPGEIVRDFMTVLNVLHQNPKLSLTQLLQGQMLPGKLLQGQLQPAAPHKVPQPDQEGGFAEFTV